MSVAEPESLPSAPAHVLPALRLLPAPSSEPPYDDELPHGARLRLVPRDPRPVPRVVPAPEPAPVPLRLLAEPVRTLVPAPGEDDDGPARTPLGELPPVRPFAQALVQRLLEVLAGLRPLSQLQRDTSFELFEALERQVPRRLCTTGVRPTQRNVRSLHVQAREDGVAEVCATVLRSGRITALAFRLEGRCGGWRCTELLGV